MTTSWWIGRAGDLRELTGEGLSITRNPDRAAAVHQLLSGGAAVDRAARSTHTWNLGWQWLEPDTWEELYALFDGQYGPGPYWLVDPTARNLLSADQATGGTARGDITGWSAAGAGESLAFTDEDVDVGTTTAVMWTLPTSPSGAVLVLPHGSGQNRATPEGWQWTFWVDLAMSITSPDPGVSARPELVWYDETGSILSTSTGSYSAVSGWARRTVTGTAPTFAVAFGVQVRVDPTTVNPGAEVLIGRAQLHIGPDSAIWRPGQGYPRVSVTAHDDALPRSGYVHTGWTLVEVGP